MTNTLVQLGWRLATLAAEAGALVLKHYEAGCGASLKADRSPVTEADVAAEALIEKGLRQIAPGVPMLAEEQCASGEPPKVGSEFFLVDPLDGTEEFLDRNGEFSVNIAFVQAGAPVIGVIAAPAKDVLYLGVVGAGAWRGPMSAAQAGRFDDFAPITARAAPEAGLVVLTSRRHPDPDTAAFLATQPITERMILGSSLKFCAIAEGIGDVYPRFVPLMQWDVGAGHALLTAAGGRMTRPDGSQLAYGPDAPCTRTQAFIARGA